MKNDRKIEHELLAELESAYQKVYDMEALLKQHGNKGGSETERPQTLSDVRDSEIRYRRLFEAAQDGILILDAESGAITDANPFIREILGYSPEDLIGKRLWEIGAFFDVVASKAAFEELQRKEYIRYENLPLQTKDGHLREVEFISNVYLVDLKKVIQCNIRNITKRREAEKALVESEIRYRRLFESAKDGILILDAETGKIIDANPFLLEILNYSREEVIGKELWEIGPFKYVISNKDTFHKLQDQEYVRYEDLLLQNKEGVNVQMEFVSNSYFMNERKVIQCNIRDITERKRAEQEIELLARFPSEDPNPVLRVEQNGKINYANMASEPLLRMWNCTVGEYLPLEWRQRVVNTIRHSAASTTIEVECEERFYLIMVVPIPYAGYINLYGRDITERKHAEKALCESENRFRTAFEYAPTGVSLAKIDGSFLQVNDALCKMLGYSREELLTMNFHDITHPDDLELTKKMVAESAIGQDIMSKFEKRYIRKDGKTIWVEISSSLLQDDKKQPLYFIVQTVNITEQKQAEDALWQMQKLEGLGTLAGGVAHDFNNILGIILAYNSSIKEFKDDSKKLNLATETITKAVERGKTLVQQILTFASKTDTSFGAVNVNNVVMEIVNMIYEMFPKSVTCLQNLDKSIPSVNADHSQLHQVLMNLCVNARDAMPKGGVLSVNTRMASVARLHTQHPNAAASSYICIEVSDTGEGMTEETRKRIFEPFFTTKEIGKGTGLGLAVVFGVVQSHKGFIDVESEIGKGTIFRIYLPALQVTEPIIEKVEETLKEIPGGTETLLIVEDEEMLMKSLRMVFDEKGYNVLSAKDGLTALKIYQERKNDIALVLTDLGLPKMNGIDVCQRIKQINPNGRIVLATGFLDPEMKSEFLKAGIKHFLYKPYDLRKVLKMIREVLDEKV